MEPAKLSNLVKQNFKMAVTKSDLNNMKEELKQFMKESNKEIMTEIRQLQTSLGDMDLTVQANKENISLLEERVLSLEEQNSMKDDRIKEMMDEVNDIQQHQRNFSVRIKGLDVPKGHKGDQFLQYIYSHAIKPALEFAKLKGELMNVPEYDKVLEYGHILPSRPNPSGSRQAPAGPPIIIVRFLSRTYLAKVLRFSYPALNPADAAKHKWDIPAEYNLPDYLANLLANIQINGDLTKRNAELLGSLRREAKKKDRIHKAWRTANGKIMYSRDPDNKNTTVVRSLFQKI